MSSTSHKYSIKRRERHGGHSKVSDNVDHDEGSSVSYSSAVRTGSTSPLIVLKKRDQSPGILSLEGTEDDSKAVPTILKRVYKSSINNEATEDATNKSRTASSVENKTSTKKKSAVSTPSPLDILNTNYKSSSTSSVTIIDNNMTPISPLELDFVVANKGVKDYFVISAVGPPQCGKSMILSYLAGDGNFGTSEIFKKRTRLQEKEISAFMTSNRILYIEIPSVFNGAATADLIAITSSQGTLETATVTWNLRLMHWALSVSHLILLIGENYINPNLFQLVGSAEVIHPIESALGDGSQPEIVYICNKVSSSTLVDERVSKKVGKLLQSVTGRESKMPVNFFMLPDLRSVETMDQAKYSEFKNHVHDFYRRNRSTFKLDAHEDRFPQTVTTMEWFQTACRLWEEMERSNFFSAYMSLLP